MTLVRRLALASLVANVVIVITGGAVRLTGSGLGCPSWPKCTDASYVATRAMGLHGAIEFGNRMLGGVVGLVAVAVLVAAWGTTHRRLAALVLAGVATQGVLGGITVRTGLNPWTVAAHFLLSMAVIAAAHALWVRTRRVDHGQARDNSDTTMARLPMINAQRAIRQLAGVLTGTAAVVLTLGTVVTGSGPHAGDPGTPRMGFDLTTVAQLHADAVFLFVGLSVAFWFALRAVGAPTRAVAVLVGVELAQGAIGFVQYFAHLPVLAVGLHLVGACAVWLATLALWPSLDVTYDTTRGIMATCPPSAVPEPRSFAST